MNEPRRQSWREGNSEPWTRIFKEWGREWSRTLGNCAKEAEWVVPIDGMSFQTWWFWRWIGQLSRSDEEQGPYLSPTPRLIAQGCEEIKPSTGESSKKLLIAKAKLTVRRGRNCSDKVTKTRDLSDDRLVSCRVHRAAVQGWSRWEIESMRDGIVWAQEATGWEITWVLVF